MTSKNLRDMISSLPPQRLLLYAGLVALLPFLIIGMQYSTQKRSLAALENAMEMVEQGEQEKERKQAQNLAVQQQYSDGDHFYIDKHLETLTFLQPEAKELQKIAINPNVVVGENIVKRLDQLTGPNNALQFVEGVVQSYPYFQETTESLAHTVEVDTEDLQELLAKIEGVQIGSYGPAEHRPQLVITELKLDKKAVRENSEVYQLNLKLLKREFL